jgi:hypothetical protein
MVKSSCFVRVLVSLLSFDFKLGSFHFVRHLLQIILVKSVYRFVLKNAVVLCLLRVGTFILTIDLSHTH